MAKKVRFRVRKIGSTWSSQFDTLEAAMECATTDWRFTEHPDYKVTQSGVVIEQVTTFEVWRQS